MEQKTDSYNVISASSKFSGHFSGDNLLTVRERHFHEIFSVLRILFVARTPALHNTTGTIDVSARPPRLRKYLFILISAPP